jgi:hypothetical protein
MKDLVRKIGSLVQPITDEKGDLSFFGLVLREDASVWDILVAAKWIDENRKQALDYLVSRVQYILTKQELLEIAGIILLQDEYFVGHSKFIDETGWEETDIDLYGVAVKKAYIFIASDVGLHLETEYTKKA